MKNIESQCCDSFFAESCLKILQAAEIQFTKHVIGKPFVFKYLKPGYEEIQLIAAERFNDHHVHCQFL